KTGELYLRTLQNDAGWQPWEKIDLTIPAAYVTPIFAFGRLYLFWSEFEETVKSELRRVADTDQANNKYDQAGVLVDDKDTKEPIQLFTINNVQYVFSISQSGLPMPKMINVPYYKPRIKYAVHNFSGAWTQPQQLLANDTAWEAELTHWEKRKPQWQRVYVQRALKSSRESLPPDEETLSNVQAFKFVKDTPFTNQLPSFGMKEWTIALLVCAKPLRALTDDYFKSYTRPPTDSITLLRYGAQQLALALRSRTKEIGGAHAELNVATTGHTAAGAINTALMSIQTKLTSRDAALSDAAPLQAAATAVTTAAKPDLTPAPDQGANPTLTNPSSNHQNLAAALAASASDTVMALTAAQEAFAVALSDDMSDNANKRDYASKWATLAERVAESAARATDGNSFGSAAAAENAARIAGAAQANAANARSAATAARTAATNARARAGDVVTALDAADKAATAAAQAERDLATEQAKQQPDPQRVAELQKTASDQRQLAANKRQEAKDNANATHTEAASAIAQAVAAATNANTALAAVETGAKAVPLWANNGYDLAISISSTTNYALRAVSANSWKQIALTLKQADGNYYVQPYVEGSAQGALMMFAANPFPPGQNLDIMPSNISPAIDLTANEIWLSSLEVWSSLRDPSTIGAKALKDDTRMRRLGFEAGLYYLPLDGSGDEPAAAVNTPTPQLDLVRRLPPIATLATHDRILVIYGEGIVRSLRGNVEDRGWTPSLDNTNVGIPNFGIHLQPTFGGAANLTRDEAARGGLFEYYPNTKPAVIPAAEGVIEGFPLDRYALGDKKEAIEKATLQSHPLKQVVDDRKRGSLFQTLLTGLTYNDSQLLDVDGQPGWFIFDAGAEEFLVSMDADGRRIMTAEERLRFAYPIDGVSGDGDTQPVTVYFAPDFALGMDSSHRPAYIFERMNTPAVNTLSEILFVDGVDGLLNLETQSTNEPDFGQFLPNQNDPTAYRGLVAPRNKLPGQAVDNRIDFDGAYGIYYREIFFHIPFLIANQLNTNQHFEEARRWYHYIFDPTSQEATNGTARYWRYRPFRELPTTPERLADMLTYTPALKRYYDDPFDPHAIADLRMSAYQKAVVMKYIDNLLDWADTLFRQDTRESINEAMPLYVLAGTLLGPRPKARPAPPNEKIGDYLDIMANNPAGVPDFVTRLDGSHPTPTTLKIPFNPNITIDTTFGVTLNQQFLGYWDRVGDRLFKIRHSLNIDGIFRTLDLFQPPINPAALVQAVASLGAGGLGAAIAALNTTVPHYRFDVVLSRAKDLTATAISLGGALLGALEKKDAEELMLLQNTHEARLLDMQTMMKQQQKQIADLGLNSLEQSYESAKRRYEYYKDLYDQNLSPLEIAQLTFLVTSKIAKGAGAILKGIAAGASAAPQFTTGGAGAFGSPVATVTVGGEQAREGLKNASEVLEIGGNIAGDIAEMLGKGAEWERRREDWGLNRDLADYDVKQLEYQIESAKLQIELAQRDLGVHLETIAQNREVGEFYRRKFSNRDLYNWMANRLTTLYFQTYRMAYDLAKQAERAYQFEFGTSDSYISVGGWDSRRKGVLAAEALLLDLERLGQSAMAQNSRYFEIEKTISLARLDPLALLQLKRTGRCQFSLGEQIFDQDYPGHYFRIIKSIAISIPAVVGPYQSVHATLTQTSHKTLLEPDVAGVEYLLGLRQDVPDSIIRADWRANQQIAISHGVEDTGTFELSFNDERYLPFENTGAVSTWLLDMPPATNPIDFDTISDVLIHLKYMTKTDSSLHDAVLDIPQIKTYRGSRLFSLAEEFVAQWQAFKNGAELVLPLPPGTLPPNLGTEYSVDVAEIRGVSAAGTIDSRPITKKFAPEYDPRARLIRLKPSNLSDTIANLLVLVNIEGMLRGYVG
ncbi:MAG TPA: neuraminidase-like domain-containing protein, partial [Roseiflexaceae bacterium]|nr:neuraminidase-like domain-containing protein [Roseiflexaceae bacterium]